ncbi:MAG: UDP-N-acetylmuramoyl-L-alanyl-D-glutamate--2,6-diaminopimelate ligase [Candidatus Pacebacteria bacterium]|nr:UDP-N-acetylmuramoyl-L-alanyl-D-glutamate--2,6-diaminopimelate ligase [Candidatus Paceibacterota bacterium]
MNLADILKKIEIKEIIGDSNIEIDNLTQDTREYFSEKTLYFAVPGTQVDGHDFIGQAIEKGSVVIVCERLPNNLDSRLKQSFSVNEKPLHGSDKVKRSDSEVVFVVVDSVSKKMGQMVSNFYGNPSEKLQIIAITGTNGKTTIATILYQSLLNLGKKTALFSTAGDFINGVEIETQKKASSSMEIIEFQKSLKQAVDSGCEYVCIEATSHALDQNRLNGTKIVGAIYTNLTQDHLDYHENFDDYAQAKQKLFSLLNIDSFALINIDDKYAAMMIEKTKAKIITYGDVDFKNPISRDILFKIENFGISGTKVLLDGNNAQVKFVGKFNMYNILSVYGALIELGFNIEEILKTLSDIDGARGRMEIVTGSREGVVGIVDYAHTSDALENVLKTLNELPHNKIITVVGAGGDRDSGKRPQMAQITQNNSDYTILTADNPRTEDLVQILNDMLAGCDSDKDNFEIISDRELAIKKAVDISTAGDIILVAGKGHEDYQIIGTTKHHFDDVEVLERYLKLKKQ